jgi:predicted transposase YbfD/YdcC
VDFAGDAVGRRQTEETGHGRRESRTYHLLEAPKGLPGFKAWRGLKSIGVVVSESVRDGKPVDEVRYFISSLPVEPDAKTFAHAVRSHWGVENGCHWTLDVTFREDESRIREKHLRENMAWLNRFSHSLLKQHPGSQSVAMKRRCCGWSDDFLMQVVSGSTC